MWAKFLKKQSLNLIKLESWIFDLYAMSSIILLNDFLCKFEDTF